MSKLPILDAPTPPLDPEDEAFLGQSEAISTQAFLTALLEDRREDVAKMIVEDDRLVKSRDAAGATAVLLAVYHGLDEMLGVLLRSEVALDLPEASAVGEIDRVRELLDDAPGEIDAPSGDGFTPLVLAATFGHLEVVLHLLEAGAEVSRPARNPTRTTPLHAASAHGDGERAAAMVEALLEAGADPNVEQAGGFVPLHQAAGKGHGAVVRRLLEAGADPEAESDLGVTARQLAEERGHLALMALLGD